MASNKQYHLRKMKKSERAIFKERLFSLNKKWNVSEMEISEVLDQIKLRFSF